MDCSSTSGRGLKRSYSDSEDESIDDSSRTPTQSDDGYGSITRKKRRGIIEKRRRDRINNCLSELRRLVPQAFEKQGSQKLEKAEILQMTVEHLRFLNSIDSYGSGNHISDPTAYENHRYATDYHSMGFRECASEVARYLSAVEGLDPQDPLRMRLLSHLQCYSSQKPPSAPVSNWPPVTQRPPQWNSIFPRADQFSSVGSQFQPPNTNGSALNLSSPNDPSSPVSLTTSRYGQPTSNTSASIPSSFTRPSNQSGFSAARSLLPQLTALSTSSSTLPTSTFPTDTNSTTILGSYAPSVLMPTASAANGDPKNLYRTTYWASELHHY